jgi:plasmid stabilization system protein ParE
VRPFVLTLEAEADVCNIWEYIASDNMDAADRVREDLYEAIHQLQHMPFMGHTREDLTSRPVRFWPVGVYLIVYQIGDDRIEIVRVLHGQRDIPTILG